MKTISKLFGGNHVPHMTCPLEKQKVLHFIQTHTGIQIPEVSAGYIQLSNSNYITLQKGYYAMCIPNDLSLFLYFCEYEKEYCCFIICRKLTPGYSQPKIMVTYPSYQTTDIFKGTLIEATRIFASENRFMILLSDILYLHGKKIEEPDYIHRLELIGEFMSKQFKEDLYRLPFRLQIATPYEKLDLLEQRIQNLPYKCNRVVFKPYNNKNATFVFTF